MAQTRLPDLHVAHRTKLIPAGAKQRRHFPPLGDGFGGVAAMLESLAVARRAATALSAAVHPAPLPPTHSRLLARCPAPGPGIATGCLVQARRIALLGSHGADPPVSIPPPSPREPDSHCR